MSVPEINRAGTVLIADGAGDFLLFRDPVGRITFDGTVSPESCFRRAAAFLQENGYIAGWLGYELGHALDRTGCHERSPSGRLGCYREVLRISRTELHGSGGRPGYARTPVFFSPDRERYLADVSRIRDFIADGDVYQINYTGELRFGFSGDPFSFFLDILREHPVPHAAYLCEEERSILSFSPELFFSVEGREIVVRPMKGTAPRSADPRRDRASRDGLAASEKDLSENLMIVDLMRNDLGRLAVPGSVHVEDLFSVESYATVHQMTSTVRARLRSGLLDPGAIEGVFRALFPCGSVTGAPRIRAMQRIHQLENRSRGVYTGSIGYIDPSGNARFNVAIRTVSIVSGWASAGAGGGIVHDSVPEQEYEEARLKTRYLDTAPGEEYSLIETILLQDGYRYLGLHLERMRHSARELGFPFDEDGIRDALDSRAASLPESGRFRVRLLLHRTGDTSVFSTPYEESPPGFGRVALWPVPVPSGDPFLRHKTTWRPWYADPAAARGAAGVDDWLFVNEAGELTEGTVSNLFVRLGGRLYTPPVACGLLPGVLRAHLLASRSDIGERRLRTADLEAAEEILIGNSVRGLRRVILGKKSPGGVPIRKMGVVYNGTTDSASRTNSQEA